MALSLTATFKGITVKDAYHKVLGVDVTNTNISFSVSFSVNDSSEVLSVKHFQCSYNIDGDNPIKQAYEHLKSLDDYSGSRDC